MDYDFVLAGFGLAGMSLLNELSKHPHFPEKKVLVVDADEKKSNDRTWSFWSKEMYGLEEVVWKSWNTGCLFEATGEKVPLGLKNYKYHTLRGLDYYNFVREKLSSFSNITFVKDRIVSCEPSGLVKCEQESYQGKLVFKSYFKKEDLPVPEGALFLWQHFKGWLIQTISDRFDPAEFTMMDYRGCSPDRTNFHYVLPHSPNKALVEFTEFSNETYSQEAYDEKIRGYLEAHWGLSEGDYEVLETEFNAIPMTDAQFAEPVQGKIVHIGTLGGYVKASSGYCFVRTMEKNRLLAAAVMQNKPIVAQTTASPKRFLAYDRAVLSLMATGKVRGQSLFTALFQKMSGDEVFQFLDEKSNFAQELKVMLSVPKKSSFVSFYIRRAFGG